MKIHMTITFNNKLERSPLVKCIFLHVRNQKVYTALLPFVWSCHIPLKLYTSHSILPLIIEDCYSYIMYHIIGH